MAVLSTNERALESFKFFPIIAWAVVILFATFVSVLSYRLKEVTVTLDTSIQNSVSVTESLTNPRNSQ